MALRRYIVRAVALGIVALSVACSALVDFDGLAGSSADASSARDASSALAKDAGTFCQSEGDAHAFCADFENVLTASQGWTQAASDPGDTISLDPLGSNSSTSARMDLPTANCGYARLIQNFDDPDDNVVEAKLAFDFRPGNTAGSGDFVNAYVANIFAGRCKWMFFPTSGELRFQVQDSPMGAPQQNDSFDLNMSTSVGTWSRAEIDVLFSSAPSVTVSINGAVIAGPHTSYADCSDTKPLSIEVGFFCSGGPGEVRVDNVVFDYH